ncbi:hypothetical protein OAM69_07145 [bacterium]|nr:hypothetical protein [bacterium]
MVAVSPQVAAQTATDELPALFNIDITTNFSPEDVATLSGIHKFKMLLDTLEEDGENLQIGIMVADDQGYLRERVISDEFRSLLLDDDMSGALVRMHQWNLEFKYPIRGKKVMLGVKDQMTPDYVLFRAAMVNHLDIAQEIVSNYDVNPNEMYESGSDLVSALIVAVANQYSEMIKLLLDAGADPNLKSTDGSIPLRLAIKGMDTKSALALYEAGADAEEIASRKWSGKPRLLDDLFRENKHEIVNLLMKNGLKLKTSSFSGVSVTHLMKALANRQSEMALALLPYSDPRFYTDEPIVREQSDIDDIAILPRTNALFLAQLRQPDIDPAIEPAIEERIEILGGKEAVVLSRLQAAIATSDMAYSKGNLSDAREILGKALDALSIDMVKNTGETNLASNVKRLLARGYELDIINENPVSDKDRALLNELSDVGESADHWHAMLEVIKLAATGDYEPLLDSWQQRYAGRQTLDWDYSKLNNWIEAMYDESDKKRLYRALDYFEFSVSDSK